MCNKYLFLPTFALLSLSLRGVFSCFLKLLSIHTKLDNSSIIIIVVVDVIENPVHLKGSGDVMALIPVYPYWNS